MRMRKDGQKETEKWEERAEIKVNSTLLAHCVRSARFLWLFFGT